MAGSNTEAEAMQHHFIITAPEAGGRIDAVLAARGVDGLSRSRLKALIEEGALQGSGGVVGNPAKKVKEGESYHLILPPLRTTKILPVQIDFGVVYEDDHLLVINKPAGLTVHPAAGNTEHTLVNALLAYCGQSLSGIGGELRPGIVHRLDKDTSGLMVVAKHDSAHQALSAQLADRSLSRTYKALVWGVPQPSQGIVETLIGRSPNNRKKMAVLKKGGKTAITHYKTERYFTTHSTSRHAAQPLVSLIECKLHTGRTHQIRVHLTHIGHPLLGDPVYGGKTTQKLAAYSDQQVQEALKERLLSFDRQALHAAEIAFCHPVSGERVCFSCNLPEDMSELLSACESALTGNNLVKP